MDYGAALFALVKLTLAHPAFLVIFAAVIATGFAIRLVAVRIRRLRTAQRSERKQKGEKDLQ